MTTASTVPVCTTAVTTSTAYRIREASLSPVAEGGNAGVDRAILSLSQGGAGAAEPARHTHSCTTKGRRMIMT
jgi:hypothetical protein